MEQRIIKFRAWDGEQMIFLSSTGIQYFDYEYGEVLSFSNEGYKEFYAHECYPSRKADYPIMQFTGLLDKHGKEIYEGDIVSIPYVDPMGRLTDSVDHNALVEYINGSFVYKMYGAKKRIELNKWCKPDKTEYVSNVGNVTTFLPDTVLEILGNIYANPSLLTP